MLVAIWLLVELLCRAGFKRVAREREVVWSSMLGIGDDDLNSVKRPYTESPNCVGRTPPSNKPNDIKVWKAKE
jgi:hypothetical protein